MQQMIMSGINTTKDDDQAVLPGFRFHPTDEELVSFYLQWKIEKQLTSLDFIKETDIYKHDPWDLAKNNNNVTDNEWYFFSKRGRKYRNSVRPNRVTGSGFWKATGIDKPIYSAEGEGHGCIIGLKKSLVYYQGTAGKGTKTDWMMHEFRLPADRKNTDTPLNANAADEEVEIWTLCRIFKRNNNVSSSIVRLGWRQSSVRRNLLKARSETVSEDSSENREGYISFGVPEGVGDHEKKPVLWDNYVEERNLQLHDLVRPNQGESSSSHVLGSEDREFFAHGNWDEIVSAMEYTFDPNHP